MHPSMFDDFHDIEVVGVATATVKAGVVDIVSPRNLSVEEAVDVAIDVEGTTMLPNATPPVDLVAARRLGATLPQPAISFRLDRKELREAWVEAEEVCGHEVEGFIVLH